MRIYEQGYVYVVSIAPGEEILTTLRTLVESRDWPAAAVWGIGAAHKIVLGYYRLHEKKYVKIPLEGEWELVSCHGTISTKDHQPFPHLHVVVSNEKGETRGGHLFEATISAAGEFVIHPLPSAMVRKHDDRIGLALL